ncbi:MAG: ferritin [Anaerolineales bacterium]|nr:ferritin [Anaerolineales bacterium]
MLISPTLEKAINAQIGREMGAQMQYINIAAYFMVEDMLLFGQIFFNQAAEENAHAMKLVRYVLDAGGSIAVPAVTQARADFKTPEDAVGAALQWEQEVTQQINELMDIAVKERDYIAQEFLGWFVNEQLEEVSKMSSILNIIKRSNGNLLLAEQYVQQTLTAIESTESGNA